MPNHYKLRGKFSWEIVSDNGDVIASEPVRDNLILTQGINAVALRSFAENVAYCAVGTSSTPPLLSDTALASEIQRTGSVDTTVGGTETILNGNVYSISKVFRFPINLAPIVIGEIGWSWSDTAGANLFSKALIVKNGVPDLITVGVAQYLRVKYTLEITISPSSIQAGDSNISGLSAAGQYNTQLIGLKKVNSDGSISDYDAGAGCNEPSSSSCSIFIGTSSAALASFGSSTNRSGGTNYTSSILSPTYLGNGRLIKFANFGKNIAASSTLRSFGIGPTSNPFTNSGFVFLSDGNMTKSADYLLTLTFLYSWGT